MRERLSRACAALAGAGLLCLVVPAVSSGAAAGRGGGEPRLSGRLVYYSSGDMAFQLLDLATKVTTKLPLPATAGHPTLSPDGRLLAYIDPHEKLRILEIATGKELVFDAPRTDYGSPAFISSRTIAYTRNTNYKLAIWLSPTDRVEERSWTGQLPDEETLSAQIAPVPGSGEEQPSFLWIGAKDMKLVSGSAPRTLLAREPGDHFRYPSVSPDGRTVAFARDIPGGIWALELAGGPPRRLDKEGSWPMYSPDGKYIAFLTTQAATRGLAIVSTRSGQELGRSAGGFLMGVSVMSADGKVAFPLMDRAGKPLHTHGDNVSWR